jgi:hypothetical protein
MMNRREFITLLGSATAGLSGTRRQLHRLGRGTACRRCGGSERLRRSPLPDFSGGIESRRLETTL